ncbi:microphthalmia-associated transcription factor-like [Narcine bancroftii]|uniref:microphthalmia-associated transcription factor-like n=1 Tax=Narcine bancroftii TaxID=1343680 RepID=UPI00383156DD
MSDDPSVPTGPGKDSENLYVVVDCSAELVNLLSVNTIQPESGIVADIDVGEILHPTGRYYELKSQPIRDSPTTEPPPPPPMTSRVLMRQQLMRDQARDEERREQRAEALMSQDRPPGPGPSSPIAVGVGLPTKVPVEILKVQTHLENPTRYHIQESQRQQVRQYLTKAGALPPAQRPPAPVLAAAVPGGPTQRHNTPAQPETEMDVFIDEIISLESSYNDDGLGLADIGFQLANTMPVTGHTLSGTSGPSQTGYPATVSNSCPAKLPGTRESSEADFKASIRERQKKDNHNLIERRRRFNINDRIKELGAMIPKSNDPEARWNKGTILKASVDYIRKLQKDSSRSKELETRQRKLEHVNKALLLRIQELEIQARVHGLSLGSPTGLSAAPLGPQPVKQEEPTAPGNVPATDMELGLGIGDSLGLGLGFDPLAELPYPLKLDSGLADVLMDDSLSPVGSRDPLLSSVSPGAGRFGLDEDPGA